ncbi:MAG: malonyl-CoA decarboxylase [Candidatus Aminicenantes bacterium]|nr:malonyl-CoA decarboxylase [Candidatus Aminicenantes bacterium]NIN20755.1 malonyl-CoA decarboxylase [Candidatus Aminicenantes bacterium]NIN44533.1 malonyl-CoA decarboxylase [Candidatus Aminicenantes bacterium]NIN87353.1 malonyl-CoA decarboxylase [Candidatus Aminicenantes bacterium]NIO83654.1 malonyl-CoA decarboxylase [Candidatus Aminicenantes bacterium]
MTRRAVTGKVGPDLSGGDEKHIKKMIDNCVFARGGEISSRSRAVELGEIYLNLSIKGRERFMKVLAREFDIDINKVIDIILKFQEPEDEDARIKAEMELSRALIPPRVKLLKQFNSLPNGFKFLIDFRAELLPIRKNDPYLQKLDADLEDILSSWFDIGLLDLKEITWQSPASLLEKLIKYEAVHEIRSWADLKNRLDSDRLCYAFFHSKMPDEPLIFVEVALVSEITNSIRKLLDEEAKTIKPEEADTAVFYSISNAQKGLAGINLGNFLIKRVVNELSNKLKGLKHFVTLSPVPNFRKWLDPILNNGDESILSPSEIKAVKSVNDHKNAAKGLLELLDSNWSIKPDVSKTLKPILMRLCVGYLLQERRGKKALDPVANFHLENGAFIERINWLGDTSEKGLKQSAGIMVNYYYKLSDIEKNHELYITESRINASKDVKKWLKKS